MASTKLQLDMVAQAADAAKKAASVLRAVRHPLRVKMLNLIVRNENRLSVTPLYKGMKIEQSECSQHLAILRKAGVVKTEREGKFIFYSVDFTKLARVKDYATMINADV